MKVIQLNLCFMLLLSACTTMTKKVVGDELKDLKGDFSQEQVNSKYKSMVSKSKVLNEKQKSDLLNLHFKVQRKTQSITKRMNKLKIISYKYLTEKEYDSDMIKEIKRQLEVQQEKKDKVLRKAEIETKQILGVGYESSMMEEYGDILFDRL
jgi:hypothetical protein